MPRAVRICERNGFRCRNPPQAVAAACRTRWAPARRAFPTL
jgi:hypothetical protein